MRRKSLEIEDKVIADYLSGVDVCAIAADCSVDRTTIYNILKRRGIVSRRQEGRTANLRGFARTGDAYTAAQKYWGGFLLADGCIAEPKRGNPILILGLKDKDRAHVEAFAQFLQSTHSVRWNKSSGQWLFQVRGAFWIEDLAPFGVTPRKTFTATVPTEFELDRDFWRGVVDGDGWVRWHRSESNSKSKRMIQIAQVGVCGTSSVCKSFQQMVKTLFPKAHCPYRQDAENCWKTGVTSSAAIEIARWLYEDAAIALERKANAAREIYQPALGI